MSVRSGIAALVVVSALGFIAQVASAGAGADQQAAFTEAERAQLARGELVERRSTREYGDMNLMGGASWQVIDGAPEVVWAALLDTAHYHRYLPQVAEARLVRESQGTRTVHVRHGGLVAASYDVSMRVESPLRDISFRIDGSPRVGVRAAWGSYSVRPYGQGKTLLAFGIMADIGHGLLTALVRPIVHEWMMKVPWMLKRFVEGSGRYIYKTHAPTAALSSAQR